MRPLRLTIRAFGPYADEVSLNFSALAARSLLLIHGPTGAGKTSILDAICFALFGETAGSDRPAKKVRSDFADASVTTEVTFDFALGDRVFRVQRCPEHPRPGGSTSRPGTATLWRLEDGASTGAESDHDNAEARCVLAAKVRDVNEHIASLLGFHVEQFRQVVLIPQGEFRRLLLADSKDREKILETLFGTELYRRIEDALKDARNELTAEIKREARGVEVLLEQAAVESLDVLRERAAAQARRVTEWSERESVARDADALAGVAVAAAEQAAAAGAELRGAQAELDDLAGRGAEQERLRLTVQRARRAQAVAGQRARYESAVARAAVAGDAARQAAESLAMATRNHAAAEKTLAFQQGRSAEREESVALVRRLEEVAAGAARAADLCRRLTDEETRLADAGGAAARSDREANQEVAVCEDLDRELAGVRELLSKTDSRRVAAREAAERSGLVGELEALRAALLEQSVLIGGLDAELRGADEAVTSAREHERVARARWAAGQAAALARTLEQGSPCPVCGSREHPDPARADASSIGDADIDAAQSGLHQTERLRQAVSAKLATAREHGATLRAKIEGIERSLGKWAEAGAADAAAALAAARQALIEVGLAENRRREIEESLGRRRAAISEASADRERARKLADEAALRCAELRGQLEEAARQGAAGDAAALADQLAAARAAAAALASAAQQAGGDQIRATSELESARAAEAKANEEVAAAAADLEQARGVFDAALAHEGFADANDAGRARLANAELDALEASMARFDAALGAATTRVERARLAAAGLETADVEAARERARAARKTLEDVVAMRAADAESLRFTEGALRSVEAAAARLDSLEKRYQVVGHVADVTAGRNDAGISLLRFVLAALLDDVLASASERLRRMSQQRFVLARAGDRRDRRSSAGLDLEVYDAHTGVARPVATLSGGESFLASLSLALALADVVQSYAGGIRLETIFIDEGFGTLDPEALDLAMRTLEDLQADGRLVGIISHVPELKERVPARLEVTPGARGSSARFVLG